MIEYLFSYGTLQRDDVQLRLFGRHLTGSYDILEGYTKVPVEIRDAAFLLTGESQHQLSLRASAAECDPVEGTVFEVSPNELKNADSYEPVEYHRVKIKLGSGTMAWVYILKDETQAA